MFKTCNYKLDQEEYGGFQKKPKKPKYEDDVVKKTKDKNKKKDYSDIRKVKRGYFEE